ncbi:hypothetical protein M876_04565 [Elizabethkingia anophelis FMS-007]|nr:hypothetical protein M876_04565 [Elizabethkingia anophelis FMS-007]
MNVKLEKRDNTAKIFLHKKSHPKEMAYCY